MNKKEDTRVIKTKATLLASFKKLLAEKPFEEISVNEICVLANVRRATFYKHFTDKYDFLKYTVGALRQDFDKMLPQNKRPDATSEYYVRYVRAIVEFLIENEGMIKNAFESAVFPTLIEVIMQKNYEDTRLRLEKSVNEGMSLPASVEVTANMITGAVANILIVWWRSGMAIPKERLIEEISSVIKSIQE